MLIWLVSLVSVNDYNVKFVFNVVVLCSTIMSSLRVFNEHCCFVFNSRT